MDQAESIPIPDMESTVHRLMAAVHSQEATMQRHEQALNHQHSEMDRHGAMLREILQTLHNRSPAPPPDPAPLVPSPPPAPSHEPRLPTPERYGGDPEECRGFLTQCRLTFDLQPAAYPSDHSRVAYVITLLKGRARSWATALYEAGSPACGSFRSFSREMMKVFAPTATGRMAAKKLLDLRQGNQSAADYAIQFRTLAAESGWGEQALQATFYHGLADRIKDELASWEEVEDLESLISRVIRLDHRLQERSRVPRGPFSEPLPCASRAPQRSEEVPEPMQLGGTRLSQAERDRRMRNNCCLYCGKPGHFRNACPELVGKAKPRPAEGGL